MPAKVPTKTQGPLLLEKSSYERRLESRQAARLFENPETRFILDMLFQLTTAGGRIHIKVPIVDVLETVLEAGDQNELPANFPEAWEGDNSRALSERACLCIQMLLEEKLVFHSGATNGSSAMLFDEGGLAYISGDLSVSQSTLEHLQLEAYSFA